MRSLEVFEQIIGRAARIGGARREGLEQRRIRVTPRQPAEPSARDVHQLNGEVAQRTPGQ